MNLRHDYIKKVMDINDQLEPEDRLKNEKILMYNLKVGD